LAQADSRVHLGQLGGRAQMGVAPSCSKVARAMPSSCDALIDTKLALQEKDLANIALLRASEEGSTEDILKALGAGADLETRRPAAITFSEDDEEEEVIEKRPNGTIKSGCNRDKDRYVGERPLSVDEQKLQRYVGMTPLMRAAKEGRPKAVKLLLMAGAHPLAKDEDGMQPLHFAASAACMESCTMLMKAGAKPNSKDDLGNDALACVPREAMMAKSDRQKWEKLLVTSTHV